MISFVLYFHSSRIENLEQTLRFLYKNEPELHSAEIILICQNQINYIKSLFENTKFFNLNLKTYNKAKMCNFGVSQCSYDIIAILDSARILPLNYFKKNLCIPKQKIASCYRLLKLSKFYTDEEIENNQFVFTEDFKSKENELLKKNLFAGNTVMWKKDYQEIGGMDENYCGHGFCDNDITELAISKGLIPIWNEETELHLYHDAFYEYEGQQKTLKEITFISVLNGLKYCKKWKKPYNSAFGKLVRETYQQLDSQPEQLQKQFKSLMRKII